MDLIKEGTMYSCIIVEYESKAIFAAEELRKYMSKISGSQIPVSHDAGSTDADHYIYIGRTQWCVDHANCHLEKEALKYDGFLLKTCNQHLVLTSETERGLLYAVYSLLEHIGCRWFYPGEYGEYVPDKKTITLPELDMIENPDFEIRGFTEDTHKKPADKWKDEMFETVDWCCKNKINSFFIHTDPAEEIEGLQDLVNEIKKRGMRFEFGGHGAHELVDRRWFKQKPELFREQSGERRKDGNFCGSNEEAIAMAVDGVRDILRKHPEVDLLHLWFADVMGGSWCDCKLCKDIHPATQQFNVINKIAQEIAKENSVIQIDMLLYHDTVEVENIVDAPEPNIVGYFAPRERCYSHSIGDSSCERNRYYYSKLKESLHVFKNNSYVFEYYADLILYRELKINISRTINTDLREYKRLGVKKISSLMFGRYSWWAYEFNMYVFARTTWRTEFDCTEGLRQMCEHLYPSAPAQMMEFYQALEAASDHMLLFCGFIGDMQERDIPLRELDFYSKHMNGCLTGIEMFERGMNILEESVPRSVGAEEERIVRNRSILDITIRAATSIYQQLLGKYVQHTEGEAGREEVKSRMEEAVGLIKDNKKAMQAVSLDIKGIAGEDIFARLCDDMAVYLEKVRENSASERH